MSEGDLTAQNRAVAELEEKKKGPVIAIKGQESIKIVDGVMRRVVPFVGTDHGGELSSLGVGYILSEDGNHGTIWGSVIPHAVIQSWRAMKILEQMPEIKSGTLCATWYAGERKVHESNERYLDDLRAQVGRRRFDETRETVLNQTPTTEELQGMLEIFRSNGVSISARELTEEIEAGNIEKTPLIDELIAADDAERMEELRREEELKKPLPPERSMASLFTDLGLGNFIIGGGFGAYGIDWGHISLTDLETGLRKNARYYPDGEELLHTTEAPLTRAQRIDSGITAYSTRVGEIEHPFVKTATGTVYTFKTARFSEDGFSVSTKVESSDGVITIENFTIPQLREELTEYIESRQRQGLSSGRRMFNRLLHRGN